MKKTLILAPEKNTQAFVRAALILSQGLGVNSLKNGMANIIGFKTDEKDETVILRSLSEYLEKADTYEVAAIEKVLVEADAEALLNGAQITMNLASINKDQEMTLENWIEVIREATLNSIEEKMYQ